MNCFEQQRTAKPLQRYGNRDIGQIAGYDNGCFSDYESTALPLSYEPQILLLQGLIGTEFRQALLLRTRYRRIFAITAPHCLATP